MERLSNSFRDPSGFVCTDEGRIFRVVLKQAKEEWQKFIESGLFFFLQEKGYLQSAKLLPPRDFESKIDFKNKDIAALVEHSEKIPCLSYPYEWSFSMLKDAALFHLELLDVCLQRGFITKDGTSYNIQFIGPRPIFLDILSFIPYSEGNPWVGFGQFSQQFLYPLFLTSYKGIPFQPWLRSELEGLDLYTARKFFSFMDIFKSGVLSNVFLPARLQKSFSKHKESIKDKILSANVIKKETIRKHISRLKKTIELLPQPRLFSPWSKYERESIYSAEDKKKKHHFIFETVKDIQPSFLLDIGANTGEYSILAAPLVKYVVAIDSDYQAIDILYRRLKEESIKNVLPLVENILNPVPDLGWKFSERLSFFKRVKPDMVLCLALLHHIVISNNIPLQKFIDWLVEISPNIVLEFVPKEDPMVKMLLKEKADTYSDYKEEALEKYLKKQGKIIKKCNFSSNSRTLYFFKRE